MNALRTAVAANEEVRSWIWGQEDFSSLENDPAVARAYQSLLRGRQSGAPTQQENGDNGGE